MWKGLRTTTLASEQEESTQERKSYGGDAIPHWAMRRCFPSHFSDASVGPSVAIGILIKITITVIDLLPCAKTFANNSINYNNSLWWILLLLSFGPITSWQIDGETMETVTDFIFLGSKITADGDCSHEIKRRLLLGRKAVTNLDSVLKSRDITLPTKVHLVKAMVFPVVMYGCEDVRVGL